MAFAYYQRLSARDRAIYRKSDAVTALRLPRPRELHAAVAELRRALGSEQRRAIEAAAQGLAAGLAGQLGLPPVRIEVLAARPAADWGELHGLYTRENGRAARIQLWMRTAHHKRVVAFRSLLRTLLHEVGHHVDYEHLGLADSFHTEGFFKRESSLFKQIVEEGPPRAGPGVGDL
jgi:hypothetical protein